MVSTVFHICNYRAAKCQVQVKQKMQTLSSTDSRNLYDLLVKLTDHGMKEGIEVLKLL